jgi:modification methylase
MLTDARSRHVAEVRADGTLKSGEHLGSIHRVGALVQGLDACNGWTFWHYARDNALRPIDELRAVARRSLAAAGA